MKCTRCDLHTRSNRVIGRGVLPCDLLIVGEAPGKVEDYFREPFVGRAGRLLSEVLRRCQEKHSGERLITVYITNLIQCRPCDSLGGPNREPVLSEVIACRQNFLSRLRRAHPKIVLLLGKVTRQHLKMICPAAYCTLHPAYVLRCGGVGSSEFNVLLNVVEEAYQDALQC